MPMHCHATRYGVGLALLLGSLYTPPLQADAPVVRDVRAKAYDLETKKLVYTMHTQETWAGQTLKKSFTRCRDPKGKLIFTRSTNYRQSPTMPGVRTENLLTGAVETAARRGSKTKVTLVEEKGEDQETEMLSPPGPVVHPGGVNALVQHHWAALRAGKSVSFSLIAPSRLAWYTFRVTGLGTTTATQRKVLKISLEPDSSMLRMFAGDMTLFYDLTTKGLAEYHGRGSVTDADGDAYDVRIVFDQEAGVAPSSAIAATP